MNNITKNDIEYDIHVPLTPKKTYKCKMKIIKNKITVGESALKVVVPNKIGEYYPSHQRDVHNRTIDETLSTLLPPVEDCVKYDIEKATGIVFDKLCSDGIKMVLPEDYPCKEYCRDIVTELFSGKAILKWKKERHGQR